MQNIPPLVAPTDDPNERNYKSDSFHLGTLTNVVLYHDYICPWCWVVFFQEKKLREEFGITFDWRGAELIPPGMEFNPPAPKPVDPNAPPKPPSRFDLFREAEGVELKSPRPSFVRSHGALLGAEFARANGAFDAYNEGVYRGFWEDHQDISDIAVLEGIAVAAGLNGAEFIKSVEAEEYNDMILPFDDDAYANGIRHVPTFIFGAEEKLAEASYTELKAATERYLLRAKKFQGK